MSDYSNRLLGNSAPASDAYADSPLHQPTFYQQPPLQQHHSLNPLSLAPVQQAQYVQPHGSPQTAFYGAAPLLVNQPAGYAAPVYGYSAPQTFIPQQLQNLGYQSADLVRVTRRMTPFNMKSHAQWPTEYPLFINSSIGYYVSNSEWNQSLATINHAYEWDTKELVAHYSVIAVFVLLFAIYYVVIAAWKDLSGVWSLAMARWVALGCLCVVYVLVLRWVRSRSFNRMVSTVNVESEKYNQPNAPSRPGKLPCVWRIDGQQLVITAIQSGGGSGSGQQQSFNASGSQQGYSFGSDSSNGSVNHSGSSASQNWWERAGQ